MVNNPNDDIVEKTQELLAESERLIEEAERKYQQTSSLLQENGLERGIGRNYINSNRISPAERDKALQELAEWSSEIESELTQAQDQAAPVRPSSAPPRRNAIRI